MIGWLSGKKTGPPSDPAPPPPTDGGPGGRRKIGKYDLIARIGGGGFGTVYEGFDPLIQRKVAIKTCEVGSPEIRARTFQEAQLAGRLQHPNITTVYEFGVEGDVPYIVQEFLPGEDLDKIIHGGAALPIPEKLKILVGIALGLEYAHRAGVIHRDVKPSNIRVLDGNAIKIMDFGIAKSQTHDAEITKAGVAVGSAGYMSPEQICGDPVDQRTDIFSFGILAYELLTGQRAFRSDTLFKLLEMVVKEEPESISELAPDVAPEIAEIVYRAMRKDPADRYQTAKELRQALVDAHDDQSAGALLPLPSPVPHDEAARLGALARFDVLDSEPEREFDDLTLLASRVCATPFALISLVDRERQWFKSRVGIEPTETRRDVSICAHAILGQEVLVVPDTRADPRFADNPLVRGEPGLRFYAGAPLVTTDGHAIGTICVLDRVPRELDASQIDSLRALSRQTMAQLELRRRVRNDRGRSGEALIREASGIAESERRP